MQYAKVDLNFNDLSRSVYAEYRSFGTDYLDGDATTAEKIAGCQAFADYILWKLTR